MTAASRSWREEGQLIGFVPTMGALHEGHLSLVRAASQECDRVVVSIFVNPLQFGPGEDFERYPRDLDGDRNLLEEAGCDVVFTSEADQLYPPGFSTYVVNDELGRRMEGEVRPGHFRGVLTVVAKLFHIVAPDLTYFGQKDAQQAVLIRRMVTDLHFPVEVRVMPIVRDVDGLALSSRNAFLSREGRGRAVSLSRGLENARSSFASGERRAAALTAAARETMERQEGVSIDYVVCVCAEDLRPVERCDRPALLLIAARVEGVRLIDNLVLSAGEADGRAEAPRKEPS